MSHSICTCLQGNTDVLRLCEMTSISQQADYSSRCLRAYDAGFATPHRSQERTTTVCTLRCCIRCVHNLRQICIQQKISTAFFVFHYHFHHASRCARHRSEPSTKEGASTTKEQSATTRASATHKSIVRLARAIRTFAIVTINQPTTTLHLKIRSAHHPHRLSWTRQSPRYEGPVETT